MRHPGQPLNSARARRWRASKRRSAPAARSARGRQAQRQRPWRALWPLAQMEIANALMTQPICEGHANRQRDLRFGAQRVRP